VDVTADEVASIEPVDPVPVPAEGPAETAAEQPAEKAVTAEEGAGAPAEDAAGAVVEEAGTHWGILKAELQKLVLFARGRNELGREDALACLGYRRAANPFDLPRLVLAKKRVEALGLVGRLLEEGISEFQILSNLSREVNRLLKARRMRAVTRAIRRRLRQWATDRSGRSGGR
jgi:hypothetical protein